MISESGNEEILSNAFHDHGFYWSDKESVSIRLQPQLIDENIDPIINSEEIVYQSELSEADQLSTGLNEIAEEISKADRINRLFKENKFLKKRNQILEDELKSVKSLLSEKQFQRVVSKKKTHWNEADIQQGIHKDRNSIVP